MTNLVLHRASDTSQALALPEPRVPGGIAIRVGTLDDLKFVDALQKKHSKMVGFLFMETLEKRTKAGHVLIAEEVSLPLPLGEGPMTAASSIKSTSCPEVSAA